MFAITGITGNVGGEVASVRHHGFDDNASLLNALAVSIVPAHLFAKADLGGSMTEASIEDVTTGEATRSA